CRGGGGLAGTGPAGPCRRRGIPGRRQAGEAGLSACQLGRGPQPGDTARSLPQRPGGGPDGGVHEHDLLQGGRPRPPLPAHGRPRRGDHQRVISGGAMKPRILIGAGRGRLLPVLDRYLTDLKLSATARGRRLVYDIETPRYTLRVAQLRWEDLRNNYSKFDM